LSEYEGEREGWGWECECGCGCEWEWGKWGEWDSASLGGVGGRAIKPCGFWLSGLAGLTDPGTFPLRFQNGGLLVSAEVVEEEEAEEEEDLRELMRGDSEASVERRAKACVTGVKALWI
jgi:hypothetical protein